MGSTLEEPRARRMPPFLVGQRAKEPQFGGIVRQFGQVIEVPGTPVRWPGGTPSGPTDTNK